MVRLQSFVIFILFIFLSVSYVFAQEEEEEKKKVEVRIKDLCRIEGIRPNQLIGYGLVVGLSGTGDDEETFFTAQSIVNMLNRLGISVDKKKMEVENVAAVIVTAQLPPFAKEGDRIDVVVSAIGNAESLSGGILLQTPLLGADKEVYAVAQGPVSIPGRLYGKKHLTVGQIPKGAIIEKAISSPIVKENTISLILNEPDFITASRIVEIINKRFTPITAKAVDPSLILVRIPEDYKENIVGFIAKIEELTLIPDTSAKVVINERTGTVVIGKDIRISEVAVSHGNIKLVIKKDAEAKPTEERVALLPPGVTINDIVTALNAIGATPEDLIAILQAIKAAGALHAEIIIM